MLRLLTFCVCLCALLQESKAQKQFLHKYEWQMQEDSLKSIVERTLKKRVSDGNNLTEDRQATKIIAGMLIRDKKLRFRFHKDNLFIKTLFAPQRSFRIVTWMFMQAPGYLVYRGVIQFKDKNKLIPLFDEVQLYTTRNNGRRIDGMNTPKKWYGALYNQIIPYSDITRQGEKKEKKYLLIGARKDHPLISTNVADVLIVRNQHKITFGDFFEMPRNAIFTPTSRRLVIHHKKGVGTILVYDKKLGVLVFDMLDFESQEKKNKINNKMYLIPIGRYQGLKYEENFGWKFVEKAFEQFDPSDFSSLKQKKQEEKKRELQRNKQEKNHYLKKKTKSK